jgi:hypothetical protein
VQNRFEHQPSQDCFRSVQSAKQYSPLGQSKEASSQSLSLRPGDIITSAELAHRWRVGKTYIERNSRNCADPIPNHKLGRKRVYEWGSKPLREWFERRMNSRE